MNDSSGTEVKMIAKGVYVTEYMKLGILPYEVKEPEYDEVRVKTMACGVCCWDSWLFRGVNAPGDMPYIIGHEGAGIIESVGSGVHDLKPGDKVFAASGSNEMMCEYFTVKRDCVVKLPDDTTDWSSVVYEPTCCVVNVIEKSNIRPGDHVVLVGAGYMGQQTLMGLTRSTPAGKITVFAHNEKRREMARQYERAEIFDPDSPEGIAEIAAIKAKGGADVCIDFSARTSGLELADALTKQAGTLVIGSFHRSDITFNGTKWHLGGLRIYNTSPMYDAHYTEMIPRTYELIKAGIYEPEKLVTHTAYFEDAEGMDYLFNRAVDKKDDYMKGIVLFTKD